MNIVKATTGDTLHLQLEGRLDISTSSLLEAELNSAPAGIKNLVFDFQSLVYVSSAGLREILSAHKKMAQAGGELIIKNASESIMDIFQMTGFTSILTIK